MTTPRATHAIIYYRRDTMKPLRRHVKDLNSNELWVSFVAEVEVQDTSPGMQGRVKTIERLFYVPIEWVTEIEVLP